ncbi:hypothetical protein SAMN05444392_101458 [Seinonella peptonophila]|uniref:Lipoprotein n=1 Tax=Seinonella peptonophila TaxID=112248 RepID=A0A1M4TGM1_9BACL|nr:hypothetical protein [Seinonella peptonophila]SHE43613.1 hypothetical protein SAMN05444392_101458 [Seinonella peptonophila]
MLRKLSIFCLLFFCVGCFYPQDKRLQLNQLPEHINHVQAAVDTYLKQNKVLPYRYQEDERKFATKYTVDLGKLGGFLNDIPPSAFEKGGYYLFALVDVERKPLVRLFDMRVSDQVSKLETEVRLYHEEKKQWPLGKPISKDYYEIDYKKLGVDSIHLSNPYDPNNQLSLIIDKWGHIYIDYRFSVMRMVQQSGKQPQNGSDMKLWLAKESLFVPAYSPNMQWQKGEPIFLEVH